LSATEAPTKRGTLMSEQGARAVSEPAPNAPKNIISVSNIT